MALIRTARAALLALPLVAGCDFASSSPPPDLTFQPIPVDLAPAPDTATPSDLTAPPDLATAPADAAMPVDSATASDSGTSPTDGGASD